MKIGYRLIEIDEAGLFSFIENGECACNLQPSANCFLPSRLLIDEHHIGMHLRILQAWPYRAYRIRVQVTNFDGPPVEAVQTQVVETLREQFPEVTVEPDSDRASGRTYYQGLCFQVHITDSSGEESFLVDGGVTDWTQKLLSNRKERLVISGMGTERLCSLFGP